jgi:hypothetical protein
MEYPDPVPVWGAYSCHITPSMAVLSRFVQQRNLYSLLWINLNKEKNWISAKNYTEANSWDIYNAKLINMVAVFVCFINIVWTTEVYIISNSYKLCEIWSLHFSDIKTVSYGKVTSCRLLLPWRWKLYIPTEAGSHLWCCTASRSRKLVLTTQQLLIMQICTYSYHLSLLCVWHTDRYKRLQQQKVSPYESKEYCSQKEQEVLAEQSLCLYSVNNS